VSPARSPRSPRSSAGGRPGSRPTSTRRSAEPSTARSPSSARSSFAHPSTVGLTATLPKFIAQPAPLPLAIDAIERGVARRSSRVWAPRYVGGALALRGILQPLTEWQLKHSKDLPASLRLADPNPDRPDEQDALMGVSRAAPALAPPAPGVRAKH